MNYRTLPTQQELNEAFDYNPQTGELFKKNGKPATHKAGPYLGVRYGGTDWAAHRIIHQMMCGDLRSHQMIDHINGDGCDNRWENLRVATPGLNSFNRRGAQENSSTGCRNVRTFRHGGREYWRVEIRALGQTRYDYCAPIHRHTPEEIQEIARRERARIEEELFGTA